jgi:hypothetical protein
MCPWKEGKGKATFRAKLHPPNSGQKRNVTPYSLVECDLGRRRYVRLGKAEYGDLHMVGSNVHGVSSQKTVIMIP